MEGYEIDRCLESMSIIVDTREQPTDKSFKRWSSFGVPYSRSTLSYGDYTFNFKLPNGRDLYLPGEHISPVVAIERKMNLEELSSCFCQSRERFQREFERAKGNNARMYLLIENGNFEKIINGRYKTKFNSQAFLGSIISWSIKYDYRIIFCQPELSGRIIKEILYRELKNLLERGYFDDKQGLDKIGPTNPGPLDME